MTMKKALTSAGLTESVESVEAVIIHKPQVKYAVFHIPTASYLQIFEPSKQKFQLDLFENKAKAGHARDDYRLFRYKTRSYEGSGLYLDEDIKQATSGRNQGYNLWTLQTKVREKVKLHQYHKEEFELIPEDQIK